MSGEYPESHPSYEHGHEHDPRRDPKAPGYVKSGDKKTVLITGCSDGGLGSALARAFWDRNYYVFATARNAGKMQAVGGLADVCMLTLDVTKSEDIRDAVRVLGDRGLDVLVNNAGQAHFSPVLDEDLDHVRRTFEVNYLAPLAITKAFAPALIKAKGVSVYITSLAGHLSIPWMSTYAAFKSGTEIMAETLRQELRPFGVDVMEIVTGAVRSNGQVGFDDYALPEGSLYKPIEPAIKNFVRGGDGIPRMDTEEYATRVADEIISGRTKGRFWCGTNAEMVRGATVPAGWNQAAMDAGAVMGSGLDTLGKYT
ncbi:short-chain dehydrogenase [Apiospora saccharicola]|uniref:Short-chain dehydrogenase n=1 Tax=Apiospora saccharicola TaxID=335842 RepID=A0ABR1W594_9PEZI